MSLSTLISTDELQDRLSDRSVVVVDCRHELSKPDWGLGEYLKNHIPGASFMHLDRDLAGPMNGRNGRHPLPDPSRFSLILGLAGIRPSSDVVAYDGQGGMYASRLWWMLRHWFGHESAAVLDGGWDRWVAEGRPVSAEESNATMMQYPVKPVSEAVNAAYVLEHLGKPGMTLLDARAPDRFRGENETLDPVGGRIPGAKNRFFRDNLSPDGCFKSPEALRADFSAATGNAPPAEVVHHCGSGVSACHNVLAMEIAGLKGSRLYAGSWSEWCSDPSRPVARGPA